MTAFLLLVLLPLAARVDAALQNLTLYRITPRNYTGLRNFDTGDSAGDVFFGLYELTAPMTCAADPRGLLCRNDPLLQIPGFNVYTQSTVEVDARFGDYAECNPSDTPPHEFGCTHFNFGQQTCWYDNPQYAKDFSDFCDRSQCMCDVVENRTVGREHLPFAGSVPPSWPDKCASSFWPQSDRSLKALGSRAYSEVNLTAEACCAACTRDAPRCKGYTLHPDGATCQLFDKVAKSAWGWPRTTPLSGAVSGIFSRTNSTAINNQVGQLATKLGGTWYSTQARGECDDGQRPDGSGACWWRLVEQTRNVNASCVNDNVIRAVRKERPECWDGCPEPSNMSTPCWIQCLFDTLVGNETKGIKPMSREAIIAPFESSFRTDDPAHGGCPEVPPCPAPCRPPGDVSGAEKPSPPPPPPAAAAASDPWSVVRQGLKSWPFGENFAFAVGNASSERALFVFERGNTSYASSRLVMESASKWPAAIAVAGLVADGTIASFDDPVHKYLRYWSKDPSDPRSRVTVRHLLSFTSGFLDDAISRPRDYPSCASDVEGGDFDACVEKLYGAARLGAEPGTQWAYNSFHLQFAGAVAAAASKLSISQVLDRYLIGKLGMNSTSWGGSNPQVATGMVTTGADFERFLSALNDYTLLPKKVADQTELDTSAPPVFPSGDGWFGHCKCDHGCRCSLLARARTSLGASRTQPLMNARRARADCMGHWFECIDYGHPDERAPMSAACTEARIHAGPGLYGYYPLIDRKRGYWMQLVVQESYARSGIPEYLRIAVKPLVDAVMLGEDLTSMNRKAFEALTLQDLADIESAFN